LDSRELTEWIAFSSIEPIGEMRADFRMANQMMLIANINRDSTKHPSPFSVKDFMPNWENKPQSVHEQIKILKRLA